MIFFIIMPGLYGGLGNYFIPIYLGIPEIIYPRINNFSLLLILISFSSIIFSIILEYSIGVGWTLYPPLSIISTIIINIIIINLIISGLSSLLSSINYLIIILLFYGIFTVYLFS